MIGRVYRRGLGQMPTLTAAQYAALNPFQQQAYGNADPNFMSATGPGVSMTAPVNSSVASTTIQSLQPTVQNPQFSTQQNVGAQPTTTFTLDSYMAQWAASSLAFPTALGGADPMAEALRVAQGYCASEGVSDCNNLTAIANKYGAMVKAAMPSAIASLPPATNSASFTQSTGSSTPAQPQGGCAGSWLWDGTAWRCTQPVVVNPSPASQPTTTGSSVASPGSALSVANGTSLQTSDSTASTDIIPGIPNTALLVGAGALVLILMTTMGHK